MDLSIKIRRNLRTSFTKLVTKIEESPELTQKNVLFSTLQPKQKELEKLDLEIFHQMVEEDRQEKEIEEELDKQDEYKLIFEKVKLSLENQNKSVFSVIERNHSLGSLQNSSNNNDVVNSNNIRLPKVELIKFGGEPKDWLNFWSIFQNIDKNNSLTHEEKFHYLFQSMIPGSRAYDVVKSFPLTAENYTKVVNELKTRFGRDGLLVQVYVRELLAIITKSYDTKFSLIQFYDNLECQLRALESLGVTSEKCAAILLPLVESCLSEELLRAWQRSTFLAGGERNETMTEEEYALQQLRKFIKSEVENEERIKLAKGQKEYSKTVCIYPRASSNNKTKSDTPTASSLVSVKKPDIRENSKCIFCLGSHKSANCFKAKDMKLEDKRKLVMENSLCFSCLGPYHKASNCKTPVKCKLCDRKHPSFLCVKSDKNSDTKVTENESNVHNLTNFLHPTQVYLQTLVVKLKHNGKERKVRALIDSGSMKSYILHSTVSELGLQSEGKESLAHSLFGGIKTNVCDHNVYHVVLSQMQNQYTCRFKVIEQNKICDNIPSVKRESSWLEELKQFDVNLTDISRSNMPIEILIGADIAGKLYTGKKIDLESGLVAFETRLGWTVMGKVPQNECSKDPSMADLSINMLILNPDISQFWKLESLGISDPSESKSKLELSELTLKHFKENVIRNDEGRYEVNLPWVENKDLLPTNLELAGKRLESTLSKASKLGYLEKYQAVFDDWQAEGIIEEVPVSSQREIRHFIPHQAVVKENSTTPLRPVCDASAHEKGKPSLNDCLEKGFNFVEKIPTLLHRFRLGKIGVSSDIKKAFLQISVQEEDRNFLAFLWRSSEKGEFKIFRHCRVVFGLVSSPFLLGAVINYHLQLSKTKFIEKIKSLSLLQESFYVDNCLTSLNSQEEIDEFISDATSIMADGLFCLRGWEYSGQHSETPQTKVLGMNWDKCEDTLHVNFDNFECSSDRVTKREILSCTQRIFDPLGVLCPVTLLPKILLQMTWEQKVKWDDELEGEINKEFLKWKKGLVYINDIKIPRWLLGTINVYGMELHTFCDSSQKAYAAVVYLRVKSSNGVFIQLIQAKSRVAPIKQITIPRLELLAATIGVRLYNSVKASSNVFTNLRAFFWSDSSTCLSWIRRSDCWAPFVKNRVDEIKGFSRGEDWRHVPGTANPADLPSRGCSAKKLLESRWWEGPEWLLLAPQEWYRDFIS